MPVFSQPDSVLLEAVRRFPVRPEARPATEGPAPHRQADQFPADDRFVPGLLAFIRMFEGVAFGQSRIPADGGALAFFLPEYGYHKGAGERFLIDNEFAHIHNHGSISLHAVLPPEAGRIVAEKNWGEQHPLAAYKVTTPANHLLFGARTAAELEQMKMLLLISYRFASGIWKAG